MPKEEMNAGSKTVLAWLLGTWPLERGTTHPPGWLIKTCLKGEEELRRLYDLGTDTIRREY